MIGIAAIATYLPEGRVDNLSRAVALGSTPSQVEERIGFRQVAVKAASETTLSMAGEALRRLIAKTNLDAQQLDVLVVITQNPDRNIPHVSAELHGLCGLSTHCACFDISLGCSGYVYGLSVISAFMAANSLKKGVLVTADPYSGIVDPTDKNTSLIFGDGATATLLSDAPYFSIGSFTFGTQGTEANKLACNDGVLFMNGRAVFNFAATHVPTDIRHAVENNGLTLADIDSFIFHQGSRFIVDTIASRLSISSDKAPFAAGDYGNTVSSSIPMILSDIFEKPEIQSVVISGFGLGFSWASTILKRKKASE